MGLLGLMYLFVHKYTARCITGTCNSRKKNWKISLVLKKKWFYVYSQNARHLETSVKWFFTLKSLYATCTFVMICRTVELVQYILWTCLVYIETPERHVLTPCAFDRYSVSRPVETSGSNRVSKSTPTVSDIVSTMDLSFLFE